MLHEHGSNNPNGVTSNGDRYAMHPYFIFKDLVTIFAFFLVLSVLVFFYPNLLGLKVKFTLFETIFKIYTSISESIVFQTILKNNLNTLLKPIIPFNMGFLFLIKLIFLCFLLLLNIFFNYTESLNIRHNKNLSVTNPDLKSWYKSTRSWKIISAIIAGILIVAPCVGDKTNTNEFYSNEASNSDKPYLAYLNELDVKKSSLFLFSLDWEKLWYKFESFDGITKTACILIFNSTFIGVCLFTIVLNLYGDYLLDRFKLEVKFPKLAIFIKYRKKIGKYYIISNIIWIFFSCTFNILFGLAILDIVYLT